MLNYLKQTSQMLQSSAKVTNCHKHLTKKGQESKTESEKSEGSIEARAALRLALKNSSKYVSCYLLMLCRKRYQINKIFACYNSGC